MKILDIALKDLLRSFRSAFALVFMFVMPLLTAGIIYFAFGGLGGDDAGFELPVTRLQVVNLDQPPLHFSFSSGEMLAGLLQYETLADLFEVIEAADEASARAAVDEQRADVAVIIPADFTAAAFDEERETAVTLYHDPTLTISPAIVQNVVSQFVDGFNGTSIATGVAAAQREERGMALDEVTSQQVAASYAAWAQGLGEALTSGDSRLFEAQPPAGQARPDNPMAGIMGRIVIAMIIFYAFFTGASTAQTILTEDEEGTLPRLFTTPTPRSFILGGKFLTVFLTTIVQVIVGLAAGRLLFDIRWGEPLPVALAVLGLVVPATGFGLLLISFLRNSRQASIVMGGALTVTGMAGGLMTSGMPNLPAAFETLTLFTPQGWVMRSWALVLEGAGVVDLLLPVAVAVGAGVIFFLVGAQIFRRRYA